MITSTEKFVFSFLDFMTERGACGQIWRETVAALTGRQ